MRESRNLYQRISDLNSALREWARGGKKGTMPKKVRANSEVTKRVCRESRVKRDRAKRKVTKRMQRERVAKGRNIRTGR